ncbi:MAG: hypothetical protein ACI9B8_003059 [Sulfitobacter sp.]|jgi:hypothetical protein
MEDIVARRWLRQRAKLWRTLQQEVTRHRKSDVTDLMASDALVRTYQIAQGDLSFAQSELPNSDLVDSLKALLLDANRELSRPATHFRSYIYHLLAVEIPLIAIGLLPKLINILIFVLIILL